MVLLLCDNYSDRSQGQSRLMVARVWVEKGMACYW